MLLNFVIVPILNGSSLLMLTNLPSYCVLASFPGSPPARRQHAGGEPGNKANCLQQWMPTLPSWSLGVPPWVAVPFTQPWWGNRVVWRNWAWKWFLNWLSTVVVIISDMFADGCKQLLECLVCQSYRSL